MISDPDRLSRCPCSKGPATAPDAGTVRVEHQGQTIGTPRPGDVFGELAMLGETT